MLDMTERRGRAGLTARLNAQRKYRLMDLSVRIGSARDAGDTQTVERLRAEREALLAEMGVV